ncbi:MAG TPA: HupE/UreJ family protein [Stellaceae bacterium]|nr:HupE/UreJ family protein [Stellaceae bacterium]
MRSRGRLVLVLAGLGAAAWLGLCGFAGAAASSHFGAAHRDWSAGFAHPFAAAGHVLAMAALGAWAALIGGRGLWLVPGGFVAAMAIGAGLAEAGFYVPGAEDGIALSVAILGVLVAVAARPRLVAGIALAALFGLVHGYAHGTEIPAGATPFPYALGFLSAALLVQAVGIALGVGARSQLGDRLRPTAAATVAGLALAGILTP